MIVQGYIVPSSDGISAAWVFSWVRPQHVEDRLPVVMPSPMQDGLPIVIGMPLLAGAVQSIIQPGNSAAYGVVNIEFPDSAIVREEK